MMAAFHAALIKLLVSLPTEFLEMATYHYVGASVLGLTLGTLSTIKHYLAITI